MGYFIAPAEDSSTEKIPYISRRCVAQAALCSAGCQPAAVSTLVPPALKPYPGASLVPDASKFNSTFALCIAPLRHSRYAPLMRCLRMSS